eukprot:Plantae.Rhodophyta-Purpureofilum_apyrenoidigerum.ctg21151.p1 GENE.Plantae.Rhodophyta-Purpureofilum_apyrenoidigerum.ctg21151~~Plantae.Rhodophyta-Purpureofilum_apyrenoidigerum.ctg21151.p1  ORF type:complete len:436 (-),score=30.76 Plantae.Rhodophyta-Purpureofilum_apyrenoidigerum.ctg21151:184-1389(-)
MERIETSVAYTTCRRCGTEVPLQNVTLHRAHCGELQERACPRCTCLNAPTENICQMCEHRFEEPSEEENSDGWTCPRCTFKNARNNLHCEMCEEEVHEEAEVVRSPPADDNRFPRAARETAYNREMDAAENELAQTTREVIYNRDTDAAGNQFVQAASEIAFNRASDTGGSRSAQVAREVGRNRAASELDGWQCAMCTFENRHSTAYCEMCHCERLLEMDPPRTAIGYRDFYPSRRTDVGIFGGDDSLAGSIAGSFLGAAMAATFASFNDGPITRNVLAGASIGAMAGAGLSSMASAMNQSRSPLSMNGFTSDLEFIEEQIMNSVGDSSPAVRAANSRTISSLPTDTARGSSDEGTCVICMEPYHSGDPVKRLPCLHSFHAQCLDEWLHRSGTCPICKHAL